MVYIIIFIYWLFFCNLKRKKWMRRKEKCTLRICAQVKELLTRKPQRGSGLLYKPIFKICLKGSEYIINSATYSQLLKFEIGNEIWININLDDPQEFSYESPYKDILIRLDIGACLLPLIAMLITLFIPK